MPVEDSVSLLTAAFILKPSAIHYWVTDPAARTASQLECHRQLGVIFHVVNLTDPNEHFNQATADFKVRQNLNLCQGGATRFCFRKEHLSDMLRLYAVNTMGGIYLDSDFMVLDPAGVQSLRACPFVVATNRVDVNQPASWSPDQPEITFTKSRQSRRTYPETFLSTASPAIERGNNGMLLGVPDSAFGREWWEYLRRWDGRGWDDASCVWPARFEREDINHRQLVLLALGLRGFEDATWPGYNASNWRTHLKLLRAANVSAAHLIGWTKERPPAVAAEISLALLARAASRYDNGENEALENGEGVDNGAARKMCIQDARAMLRSEAYAPPRSRKG